MASSKAIVQFQGNIPAAVQVPTGASRATLNVQVPPGNGQQASGFITLEVPIVTDPSAWTASHAYTSGNTIKDSNGNIQYCTASGTSGSSAPTWKTDLGDLTTDNGATWQMIGDEIVDFVQGACTVSITQP